VENTQHGKKLVDLNTLAEVKSISVFTLRKYARDEGMPHYRVGRKIIVNPFDFDEWFIARNSITNDAKAKSVHDMLDEVLHEIA